MNLCSSCLNKAGLTVPHPQLLTMIKWCDGCHEKRMAFDIIAVTKQILES